MTTEELKELAKDLSPDPAIYPRTHGKIFGNDLIQKIIFGLVDKINELENELKILATEK
jgi:hypothetical protein